MTEWISVDERLPERRKRVLLISNCEIYVGWRYKHGPWVTENTGNDCYRCNGRDIVYNVSHWMELPKPQFLIDLEIEVENRIANHVVNGKYIKGRFDRFMSQLGIKNVEQFSEYTREQLLQYRNVGVKLISYIEDKLSKIGLALKN